MLAKALPTPARCSQSMNSTGNLCRRALLIAGTAMALVLGTAAAHGQQQPQSDLTSISLEDLTQVKVYSASKHLEDSDDPPSAVTIITADDIRRYGWRTLAEVLSSVRGFYTFYDRDYVYLGVLGVLRPTDYNSRILLLINRHRLNDHVCDSALIGTEFPLDMDLVETNLTISTKPLWKDWRFSASCYNLFNSTYYLPGGPELAMPSIQQDGRSFRVTLSHGLPLGKEGKGHD